RAASREARIGPPTGRELRVAQALDRLQAFDGVAAGAEERPPRRVDDGVAPREDHVDAPRALRVEDVLAAEAQGIEPQRVDRGRDRERVRAIVGGDREEPLALEAGEEPQ